jgi:hypothetical protein
MITERLAPFLKFDSEERKKKLRPSAAMRVKTARRNRPPPRVLRSTI